MKTIGLIGGTSWESSIEYYRIINKTVKEKLGGLHSAKSVMYSVDFAEIETLQHEGRWDEATQAMIAAARHVEADGAVRYYHHPRGRCCGVRTIRNIGVLSCPTQQMYSSLVRVSTAPAWPFTWQNAG